MVRTLLVLLFLAFCGSYFYGQSQPEPPAPAKSDASRKVDDSGLEALRRALPQRLFEKDVEPALERNRKEGLTSAEVQALVARLATIGRALDSKTEEAVDKAVTSLSSALPPQKDMAERTAEAAGQIARSVGEGVKENMPAVKELASDVLRSMAAMLSRFLSAAADLLQK
ncbi:hypothetical protein [Mailhella sp.]|uniref:hypothetical protein n=1 Tax=Mailhella sp. TaxID=1981029 RepID=UPI00406384A2